MIKLIIFDMDGLMIESEPLHLKAYNTALEPYGFLLNLKQYAKYFGVSDNDILKDLIKNFSLKISKEDFMKKKDFFYKKYLLKEITAKKGLFNLIKQLKENGFLLAVASSAHTDEIGIVLSRLKIDNYFSMIVSADNVKKAKPSPDIYLLTASKLKITPNECLVLEDSPKGVIAAKRAKMKCYAIPSKGTEYQEFIIADRILKDLTRVYTFIIKDFGPIE